MDDPNLPTPDPADILPGLPPGVPKPAEPEAPPNPWISIFFRPRDTIKHIVENSPTKLVHTLVFFATAMETVMQFNADMVAQAGLPPLIAVSIAALVGGVVGIITLYLFGWLYGMVGRWFGGVGVSRDCRAALAWTKVPTFVVFGAWLVASLLIRRWISFGAGAQLGGSPVEIAVYAGVGLIAVVMGVWSFVILCKALGEVQGFSAIRGAVTIGVSGFVLVIPIIMLGVVAAIVVPNLMSLGGGGVGGVVSRPASTITQTPTGGDANLLVEEGRVILHDGRVYEGTILYEDHRTVYIETEDGALNFPKADVKKVERGSN